MVRTGATFADAAAEWLRYIEFDRDRKPSTVAGYQAIVRSQLLPAFGELPIESITTAMIERWIGTLGRASSSRIKALVLLHGIFRRAKKVWGLPANPVTEVEKPPLRGTGNIDVFSPEEVHALVRAAASEQDAALFMAAAFTRMIAKADIRRVQEWMGHSSIRTTMQYLHFAPRPEDARLVAEAFALATPEVIEQPTDP